MIAAWMLFSVVTGFALTAAAVGADRFASLLGRPRRFIWLTAMVATSCWPVIAIIRTAIVGSFFGRPDLLVTSVNRLSPLAVVATGTGIDSRWNAVLLGIWALVSSALIVRFAAGVWQIRQRQAEWGVSEIDGVSILVAPDAGPAVLGFRRMQVVVPAWVLEMDASLRALILRHEAEHRSARDPYMLLVATLMTALAPWNLPLWIQARRLRLVIELDCDARVLRAHPGWHQYALLLLTIAQRRSLKAQGLAPALSEPTLNLERRITAMRTPPKLSLFQAACLAVVVAAGFGIACAVDKPQSPDRLSSRQSAIHEGNPVTSVAESPKPGANGYFEFQVERPATLRERGPLVYPALMKQSGIGGEVWAQFVVDETGEVQMQTLKVLKSPGPEFTAAVRATLPTWRFDPAIVAGRNVKQLVQQAFVFQPPAA